jgi:ABC-2 type transport system ATP-binding protein
MIEVSGLTRYYGETKAIADLSFSIGANEIVGLLGLNGAGKTTTLKILAGLLHPTSGTVRIEGQDLFGANLDARRQLGFLPEVAPLYTEMRVRDYLRYLGSLRGMDPAGLDSAIDEVAERTHMVEALDVVIDTLSYGYRKRVGIAQAILHRPRWVILDEPIGGLDPVQIVGMRKVIANLRDSCTVLVSSHILSEVSQTCDRLLILKQGRLVAEGSEQDLSHIAEHASSLRVELRMAAEAFDGMVGGLEMVKSVAVLRAEGDLLTARVDLTGDHREAFVAALVQAGVGVRRVEDAESELEDIFLELTANQPSKKLS